MRRPAALGAAALVVLVLAACSGGSSITDEATSSGGGGYVAGDGSVERIAVADRSTSIRVQGTTLDGQALDTSSYRGKVVVLNTWGSWCPPCNAEAPTLQKTWTAQRDRDVQFVGIALRESPATGQAFERKYAITYPSVQWDGGQVLLQLKGKAPSPPTTLVLDAEGRLAARVVGKVDGTTLTGLIDDVRGSS